MAQGFRGWNLDSSDPTGQVYVRAKGSRVMVIAARLIADVGEGQVVSYLDGDPRNLRLANLSVQKVADVQK